MKPTRTIFVCVLAAGLASAQSPSIIQNTRATMNGVRDNAAAASNAALAGQDQVPSAAVATHSQPKPATVATVGVKPSAKTSAKTSSKVSVAKPSVAKPGVAKPKATAAIQKSAAPKAALVTTKAIEPASAPVASNTAAGAPSDASADDQSASDKKWNNNGKRDPFVSPVVSHAGGSGCSTGKKCLEIGAINLRGIVHSESGFIAVVSNGLNKAYFLRENDPVFNGYVMKITGDSITFQETLQDRLGKTFTREIVKKITTPAV